MPDCSVSGKVREKVMTFIRIKYFLAVADCLNFTKAAEQLFVTQQVISKQIKQLETEIGFALFRRNKRNVSLTEGGAMLYDFWKEMFDRYNEVVNNAYNVMSQKGQIVRIGTIDVSRIYDWIANAVTAACTEESTLHFRVDSGSYRYLFQGLIDGRYDCIISLEDENRGLPKDYEEIVLYRSHPKLVMADNCPAFHEGVTLNEMKDYTLYTFSAKFSKNARKNILQHCIGVGAEPSNVEEFDEISSLEMALHTGKGYTVVYEPFFRNPAGKLHFFDVDENRTKAVTGFTAAYPRSKKKMLDSFLKAIQFYFGS